MARHARTMKWGMTRIQRTNRPMNGIPHSLFWPWSRATVTVNGYDDTTTSLPLLPPGSSASAVYPSSDGLIPSDAHRPRVLPGLGDMRLIGDRMNLTDGMQRGGTGRAAIVVE